MPVHVRVTDFSKWLPWQAITLHVLTLQATSQTRTYSAAYNMWGHTELTGIRCVWGFTGIRYSMCMRVFVCLCIVLCAYSALFRQTSPDVWQWHAAVHCSLNFLQLLFLIMHCVVHRDVTRWMTFWGTEGRELRTGKRPSFSIRHPIESGGGSAGCCLSAWSHTAAW